MSQNYFFTSESVSEGHPDKVADQISDSILDALLTQDKYARVACETLVKSGVVVIAGEISAKANVAYSDIARKTILDIGYDKPELGFDGRSCGVLCAIDEQSPDIAQGVDKGQGLHVEQGAGDQGMMFGFACNETTELMPATISYSHKILKSLSDQRKSQRVSFLRPDAKSQVTAEYKDGKLARIDTVVVSAQHSPDIDQGELREFIIEEGIKKSIPQELLKDTTFHINPTGKFVIGGPVADAGLTGRKIIVDTYGGHGAHGGGAFSGKDPTKVDRSAAYMGRFIAKNLVAAGLADKCLVQLAYAIGVAKPVSVFVETYGTGKLSSEKISQIVKEEFRLTPSEIIEQLDLLRPIYGPTAAYGHFGHESYPWESTSKAADLKKYL